MKIRLQIVHMAIIHRCHFYVYNSHFSTCFSLLYKILGYWSQFYHVSCNIKWIWHGSVIHIISLQMLYMRKLDRLNILILGKWFGPCVVWYPSDIQGFLGMHAYQCVVLLPFMLYIFSVLIYSQNSDRSSIFVFKFLNCLDESYIL